MFTLCNQPARANPLFRPHGPVKTTNPRAVAFYELPEDTRLAVIVCLEQERRRLGEIQSKIKMTVHDVAARVGLAVGVFERHLRIAKESWIGLTTEDPRRVVARAAVSDAPGVCVVAAGDEKATLLMMLIEPGLVSQAIVDHSLAAKLANLLRRPTSDSHA
mgnify:CR=1 FL=1